MCDLISCLQSGGGERGGRRGKGSDSLEGGQEFRGGRGSHTDTPRPHGPPGLSARKCGDCGPWALCLPTGAEF